MPITWLSPRANRPCGLFFWTMKLVKSGPQFSRVARENQLGWRPYLRIDDAVLGGRRPTYRVDRRDANSWRFIKNGRVIIHKWYIEYSKPELCVSWLPTKYAPRPSWAGHFWNKKIGQVVYLMCGFGWNLISPPRWRLQIPSIRPHQTANLLCATFQIWKGWGGTSILPSRQQDKEIRKWGQDKEIRKWLSGTIKIMIQDPSFSSEIPKTNRLLRQVFNSVGHQIPRYPIPILNVRIQ
jgi:hypothetical protein